VATTPINAVAFPIIVPSDIFGMHSVTAISRK